MPKLPPRLHPTSIIESLLANEGVEIGRGPCSEISVDRGISDLPKRYQPMSDVLPLEIGDF